jgi:tetratricopeptide (TPR) repeat protein
MTMKAYTLAAAGKKYEKAMSIIKDALSIVPNDPRSILTEGFILLKMGKYDNALSRFDNLLQRNESNTDAWYLKAEVELALKDYDDALRCYNQALEIDPQFAEAYNAKAVILLKKMKEKMR